MTDEARVDRIEPDAAAAEVKPTFDQFIRERGKVPNLYRVAAHVPRIATGLATFQNAIMGPGSVDVLLKELLATRVSHINLCDY